MHVDNRDKYLKIIANPTFSFLKKILKKKRRRIGFDCICVAYKKRGERGGGGCRSICVPFLVSDGGIYNPLKYPYRHVQQQTQKVLASFLSS